MTLAEAQADAAARATPKSAARRAAGRSARAQGERPEVALKLLHDAYERAGAALVRKLETPVKRVSKAGPGRFQAVYLARAHVDFAGWVQTASGPRPIDLEVKTTGAESIALDVVSDVQARQLGAMSAAGGLAYVLACVAGVWWLVPWSAWRSPACEPKRKSLRAEHLDVAGVRVRVRAGGAPDWLPALLQVIP